MAGESVRVVDAQDLTNEDQPGQTKFVRNPFKPKKKPADLEIEREAKRGQIALILVWLLVGIVTAAFLVTYLRSLTSVDVGGIAVKDVKEILTVIFSPVVALVGAVTGFYFGGQSERSTSATTTVDEQEPQ